MSRITTCCSFLLGIAIGGATVISANCALAQITPDGTLTNNSIVTPDGSSFNITGGTQAGSNLFHSFKDFSVPNGGTAIFNNALDIQNIISRVTGGSVSNIDGIIRANGNANLFLINPAGIIFGKNASLNIGGSFLATTASSLKFSDGAEFNAKAPQTTPLLTISVPIGLQFEGTAGSILNQSKATISIGGSGFYFVGLQVQPGRTLALVGNGVALENGTLTAEKGRIELGSVGSSSTVKLNSNEQGWVLGYEGVENFQDIQVSPGANSGAFADDIQVRGRQVRLTSPIGSYGGAQIRSAKNLVVTASDIVEVSGGSGLSAGDLSITTGKLIVRDGASVSVRAFGGSKGNLIINASDSVEVFGIGDGFFSSLFSSLSAANLDDGTAGDLSITTRKLSVRDGAKITTNTSGAGNAGNLKIQAINSVEVSGESRILALTSPGSTGAGGNLTIETKRWEGTPFAARSLSLGQGSVGKITIISPEPLPNVEAQIVPDETLPIRTTVKSNFNSSIIEGGTQAGSNLFHSFAQFSLPTLNTAYFNNALDVKNIIARVTGSSVSNIDGMIQANGNANIFLLNPNGIIFGRNALLNIGGSFVGSTATNLKFADGLQFGATVPQTTPALTMSIPVGLQFGGNTGSILNQSNFGGFNIGGFQVKPGNTIALVGGNVSLDGAYLSAPSGRVELGGVAGVGTVGLNIDGNNLRLMSFPNELARADVSLTNGSNVNVFGNVADGIQVQGKRVTIDGSSINSQTSKSGGTITINASDSLLVKDSGIYVNGLGGGESGDLTLTAKELVELTDSSALRNQGGGSVNIQAKKLIFRAEAPFTNISTITFDRKGGNINITAPESVEFIGSTYITSKTLGTGDGGDIKIDTGKLVLTTNSRPFSSTFDSPWIETVTINPQRSSSKTQSSESGKAGNLIINAKESVEMSGGLMTTSTYSRGAAGNVTIQTGKLSVRDGARITASTGGDGLGGNLTINAKESVEVSGKSATYGQLSPFISQLSTDTSGRGIGGNINIQTGRLEVKDSAEVNVSSKGSGTAGSLQVQANSIRLDNGATLRADTTAGQGNINLRSGGLILRRGSSITTNATGSQVIGGNITIDTAVLAAFEDSDISANSADFRGGNVQIKAQGIFGTQFRDASTSKSDITATGGSPELKGSVELNTPDINRNRGLVQLPTNLVDVSQEIDNSCNPGIGQRASSFVMTGRSGLPPSPLEMLTPDAVQVDWVTLDPNIDNRKSPFTSTNPTTRAPEPIVEATGWMFNAKGEIVLTSDTPTTTHEPWQNPVSCRASKDLEIFRDS